MEADQKINMALDDIIMYERLKNENSSVPSHKSVLGFRANGVTKGFVGKPQDGSGDPSSIQNLHYSRNGPLANRNFKRFGSFQRAQLAKAQNTPYWRNRVRYATQFLNRTRRPQRNLPQQRAHPSAFVRNNRLLALKRLQTAQALRMKMRRSRGDSDNLSVIIPNDFAMRQRSRSAFRGRSNSQSQLTVRNMRKFDALSGNVMRSRNGSVYSADYRSKRSRSASVGRHSRGASPSRNFGGSLGRHSRAGTPANSEASGYSVRNFYRRLLNYNTQRQIAMLQSRSVSVDPSGRPVIFCSGQGLDVEVTPVGTSQTFHERFSVMLQNL